MHCLHAEGEKIFVQKAVVLQLVIPWQFFSCAYPGMRKTCPYLPGSPAKEEKATEK